MVSCGIFYYMAKKKISYIALKEIVSDLLINLSAGWFGVIFIVPNFSGLNNITEFTILTFDLIMAILCLVISYLFKTSK